MRAHICRRRLANVFIGALVLLFGCVGDWSLAEKAADADAASPPIEDGESPNLADATMSDPGPADGSLTTTDAGSNLPSCVSTGQCECIEDQDCRTPSAPHCELGRCVRCARNAHCDQVAHEICVNDLCVVGPYCGDRMVNQANEQCDDGNTSNGDACVNCRNATCGDGYVRLQAEYCDPQANGWSAWTCGPDCQPVTQYTACADNTDCTGGWSCLNGMCTIACTEVGECPSVPIGNGSTLCGGFCIEVCMQQMDCAPTLLCRRSPPDAPSGFCGATSCAVDRDCTAPTYCVKGEGAAYGHCAPR